MAHLKKVKYNGKPHIFAKESKLFTEKVGFLCEKLGLSFEKAMIFLRKLFFRLKSDFSGKRCNFHWKKDVQSAKDSEEYILDQIFLVNNSWNSFVNFRMFSHKFCCLKDERFTVWYACYLTFSIVPHFRDG